MDICLYVCMFVYRCVPLAQLLVCIIYVCIISDLEVGDVGLPRCVCRICACESAFVCVSYTYVHWLYISMCVICV